MSSTSSTTSVLAEHYKGIGREEKAHALRTWLNAVGVSLKDDYEKQKAAMQADGTGNDPSVINDLAELRGAMSIISTLLERMNEASDAAPCMCGRPEGHAVHDMGMPNGHAFQDSSNHPAAP